MSKRVAWFLVAFAVWSWVIWPTFLKNIWADPRSWNHGMTAFFGVHLVLTVVSLVLGTAIGVLGVRGLRRPVVALRRSVHRDENVAASGCCAGCGTDSVTTSEVRPEGDIVARWTRARH